MSRSERKSDLSRRNFLKGTAAGVGATAFLGAAVEAGARTDAPKKWDFRKGGVKQGQGRSKIVTPDL